MLLFLAFLSSCSNKTRLSVPLVMLICSPPCSMSPMVRFDEETQPAPSWNKITTKSSRAPFACSSSSVQSELFA